MKRLALAALSALVVSGVAFDASGAAETKGTDAHKIANKDAGVRILRVVIEFPIADSRLRRTHHVDSDVDSQRFGLLPQGPPTETEPVAVFLCQGMGRQSPSPGLQSEPVDPTRGLPRVEGPRAAFSTCHTSETSRCNGIGGCYRPFWEF